ncbi:MAG: hypothetical protein OXF02_07000 [Simkaniaceae bacterium]|nr:hypothetical protein [Simkaniaceae bacterium]
MGTTKEWDTMKETLTKESLRDLFSDNFEMTNYAIKLAREQILSGNDELRIADILHEMRYHSSDKAASIGSDG